MRVIFIFSLIFSVKAKYGDVALDESESSEEEDDDAEVCIQYITFF